MVNSTGPTETFGRGKGVKLRLVDMVDSWVFVTYHSLMDLWDHYKWPYKLITGVITPTSFVFEKNVEIFGL